MNTLFKNKHLLLFVFTSTIILSNLNATTTDYSLVKDSLVLEVADQMPEFPGGNTKLIEYINQNLQYPSAAVGNKVQGRVVTSFTVQKDGSIEDIKIVKGINELNAEAKRLVSSMPKWNPGVHNGEVVAVKYILAIPFKLKLLRDEMPKMETVPGVIQYPEEEGIEMPKFPGGEAGLMLFIAENTHYPSKAMKQKIEGRVILEIIVNEKGKVTEPTILKGVHPLLDNEALRIAKQMPKWKPGTKDGKPVSVRYAFPLMFKLPKK